MVQLFKTNSLALAIFIPLDHANSHGLKKGSATHAASGTTLCPSVTAIVKRGDWSMGKILDIYWKFANTGDYFLGRVLALLDPNSSDFESLPLNFDLDDPLGDEDVKAAIEMCFGIIINAHRDLF